MCSIHVHHPIEERSHVVGVYLTTKGDEESTDSWMWGFTTKNGELKHYLNWLSGYGFHMVSYGFIWLHMVSYGFIENVGG